ncbi:MAG: hypothetical protein CM15mP120_17810 [Pseudomonadota bacterium]|nr:MAG: hypothetical protein CM15mP120_17810 [Pseudomonadota bacterium]
MRAATYVPIYGRYYGWSRVYLASDRSGEGSYPRSHYSSLEAVFGALGGYMFLQEQLSGRELIGCVLMLMGMLVSKSLGATSLGCFELKLQLKRRQKYAGGTVWICGIVVVNRLILGFSNLGVRSSLALPGFFGSTRIT